MFREKTSRHAIKHSHQAVLYFSKFFSQSLNGKQIFQLARAAKR